MQSIQLYNDLVRLPRETRLRAFHQADLKVRSLRQCKANGGRVTVATMAKALAERKAAERALRQTGEVAA